MCFRIEDHAGLAPPARQIDVKNRAAAGRIGKGHLAVKPLDDLLHDAEAEAGAALRTRKLPYDLMKDFEPTGLIATQPFFIVARKTMPANTLKKLIAWLRANGDKANEGNSGVSSPSHVSGILFQQAVGVPLTMVPYRGAGDSTAALLAGQIDVMLNTPALSVRR